MAAVIMIVNYDCKTFIVQATSGRNWQLISPHCLRLDWFQNQHFVSDESQETSQSNVEDSSASEASNVVAVDANKTAPVDTRRQGVDKSLQTDTFLVSTL